MGVSITTPIDSKESPEAAPGEPVFRRKSMMAHSSTIAAIATPLASGGIGVIRLTGSTALSVAAAVFRPYAGSAGKTLSPDLETLHSHRLYPGRIYDNSQLIDEVMLVVMKAPHSYTGEDVVEIHAHGGPFVLKTILALLLQNGAEAAGPGEFTRRAFVNGKMDLTRAEAVADIIEATSERSLAVAAAQVAGALREEIIQLREHLLSVLAEIDTAADVGEQTGIDINREDILIRLQNTVLAGIEAMLSRPGALGGRLEGLRVVLAGAPNVGKSTLLNRLLGENRAIVTSQPGTTRDVIEGEVLAHGHRFLFADTAGLRRQPGCEVEQMGVERATRAINAADMVFFLLDGAAGVSDNDRVVFSRVKDKPLIVVVNKMDLPDAEKTEVPQLWRDEFSIRQISAKTGEGVSGLWQELEAWLRKEGALLPGEVVPNLRHQKALESARTGVLSAISALEGGIPADVVTIDLRTAWSALGEILGEHIRPDVLETIFERFCVGK